MVRYLVGDHLPLAATHSLHSGWSLAGGSTVRFKNIFTQYFEPISKSFAFRMRHPSGDVRFHRTPDNIAMLAFLRLKYPGYANINMFQRVETFSFLRFFRTFTH